MQIFFLISCKNYENLKIQEFHAIIKEIMKINECYWRTTKSRKLRTPNENYENYCNHENLDRESINLDRGM